jgi:serine/threonine-protein kinase RsbT
MSETNPVALCGSGAPCGRCVPGRAVIALRSRADIVVARLAARTMAREAGVGPLEQARLVTALTEVGQNAVLYAGGGVCQLADLSDARQLRLQVLVCDRGPGIDNIERVLRDGYALGGSLGGGLPGVRRMVDVFELQSPPEGTCITLQIIRPRLPVETAAPAPPAALPPAAWGAG